MKILHLCLACFYIDNYSYQENLLPKYHKDLGADVAIIASLVSFNEKGESIFLAKSSTYINENGIPVTRLDYFANNKLFKKLRIYKDLYQHISKFKPDTIFIHGLQFADISQVVKYYKVNPQVKIYIDNHADLYNSCNSWFSTNILHKIVWRYYAHTIEPFTNKFFGVTPWRCQFLKEIYGLPKDKIQLLVMGVDDKSINYNKQREIREKIRKELEISIDTFLLITGGKIDKQKNIHLLLQAVSEMKRSNVKLLIFGTIKDDVKEIFDEYNKSNSIIFLGWKNSEEINNLLLSSDLAVFPGTHSTLWEQAVGIGIPTVFKFWPQMTHLDAGGNCEFINDVDKSSISEILLRIIDNPHVYNSMLQRSISNGRTSFSYSQIAMKSLELD